MATVTLPQNSARSSKWATKNLRDWVVDYKYQNPVQRICYRHFAQNKYWTNGCTSMWLKHETKTKMQILPKLYMHYYVEFFEKWESVTILLLLIMLIALMVLNKLLTTSMGFPGLYVIYGFEVHLGLLSRGKGLILLIHTKTPCYI